MTNKILIIDDAATVHQIYNMVLSRYKSEVISAFSGEEGLKRLTEHPDINLIIVDAHMPHMSGMEFIKKVKEQIVFNDIPIIFVGSYEEKDEVLDALTITQGYLKKPFTSSEFHSLIAEVARKYAQTNTSH